MMAMDMMMKAPANRPARPKSLPVVYRHGNAGNCHHDADVEASARLRAEIGAQQLAAARQVHKAAVLRWLVRRDQVAAAALCRAIEIEHRCRQRVARALIQHSRPSTR